MTGESLAACQRGTYLAAWRALWDLVGHVPNSLVLRDYHVDNLMVLAGRKRVQSCGLLDFQDALCGPVSYDLVSLLQDARRDMAPGLESAMFSRYLDGLGNIDRRAFEISYRILGAQRAAKIIGIFTRLSRRDGKNRYLDHIPRVWSILERNLEDPILQPLAEWFDRTLPADIRVQPSPHSSN